MSVPHVPDMSTEAEQSLSQVTDSDHSQQGPTDSSQPVQNPTPPPASLSFPLPPHTSPNPTLAIPPSSQDSIPQSSQETSHDIHAHLFPISSALNALRDDTASESAASWESPLRSSPLPSSSSSLLPKVNVSIGNGVPVLTKTEPDDSQVKIELLDHLKREYFGPSSTKEGQLRGLLTMTSIKTSADDTASKTLLELAGQSVDIKIPEASFLASAGGGGGAAAALQSSDASQSSVASQSSAPDSSLCPPGQATVSSFSAGFSGVEKKEVDMDSGKPKKVRHKKRVNGNKICLVCGDKALAHNFDVITCESCKAFFRRNALKSQNLQRCMFQNNCTIDKNTRRFCPSCRLKKCFDIGMKADLMLDEEERRLRREKKAQRIRQQAASSSTPANEDSSDFLVDSSNTLDPTTSFHPETSTTITSTASSTLHSSSFPPSDLLQVPSHHQPSALPSFHTMRDPIGQSPSTAGQSSPYSQNSALGVSPGMSHSQPTSAETSPFSSFMGHLSSSSPVPFAANLPAAQHPAAQAVSQSEGGFALGTGYGSSSDVDLSSQRNLQPEGQQHRQEEDPFQESTSTGESHQLPLPGPAARMFKHVPRDQLPSDPFMYWIVSSEERLMLANLTNAYQNVLLNLPERSLNRNMPLSDSYFIHDFLNEIDDAMYKIVQFSKHIADFRQMRKEDQIAMLKSSAMHTFGIACCAAYVHERDCWLSLRGDLTSSHLRKLTNDDPYIQIGVEYCRAVKSLVKNDFTIYALIHCMILFDPRDAKILDRQMINQTRDKYVIMLKHYLESQYSYLYADGYFVAIQERVREIIHLAKSGNAMFKRYSSAFQPLITEMLSST